MPYHLPRAPTTDGKYSDDDHDGGADDHDDTDDYDDDDEDDNGNDDGDDLVGDMPKTTGLTSYERLGDEADPTHCAN